MMTRAQRDAILDRASNGLMFVDMSRDEKLEFCELIRKLGTDWEDMENEQAA